MAAEHVVRMGRRIRERRKELDLTQEDVARAMPGRTSGNQVSRWERGANRIGEQQLEHLAKVLDVPVAWFMVDGPTAPVPDLMREMSGPRPAGSRDRHLERIEAKIDRIAKFLSEQAGGSAQRDLIAAFEQLDREMSADTDPRST